MYKIRALCMAAVLLLALRPAHAQSITATLTGLVTDASEAVVPNAKVTITNAISGDVRRTITNNDGYFTFASLPAGTYKVTVDAAGFMPYELSDVQFTGAEKRNVNVVMKVEGTSEK